MKVQPARCPSCGGRLSFWGIAARCVKRNLPWTRYDVCEPCRVWVVSGDEGQVLGTTSDGALPIGPRCSTC